MRTRIVIMKEVRRRIAAHLVKRKRVNMMVKK